jgi:hypothetical protein
MKQQNMNGLEREKIYTMGSLPFFLFILLCIISLTSALTIQELISSYSFDYYGDQIDITNITDSLNSNILSFNVMVSNATSDTYTSYIDLEDVGGIISGESNDVLTSSDGTIQINISTYELSGADQFDYTLRIYDSNDSLVYRQGNLTTGVYSSYDSGYDVLGVIDSNVNNDLIRLNVSINSSEALTKNISIFLEYGDNFISATSEESLASGLNYIILDFDNETLKSTHYNGVYNISGVLIGEKLVLFNHTTNSYDFEDFAKTSYLSSYDSSFVDSDANNLTDYLEFDFGIEVKDAGTYRVEADIYDLYGQYLASINESELLSVGSRTISGQVNGSLIYSLGINGPYLVSVARLYLGGVLVDLERERDITNITSYYDFERPPLPDLEIVMNSSYDGKVNIVNVSVENVGTAVAFNVVVDLFDSGEFERQVVVDRLNVSEVYSFEIVMNESFEGEILVGVVDFNNLIDEGNESNNVGFATLVNPYFAFYNASGYAVAWFDGFGSLNLKGNCSISANCVAPQDSLIFLDSNKTTVAYIDSSGNICLESGSCSDNQSSCDPSEDAFIVQDSLGYNLSYIDFSGEMCLTGSLREGVL